MRIATMAFGWLFFLSHPVLAATWPGAWLSGDGGGGTVISVRAAVAPTIDGKLTEAEWQKAHGVAGFVRTASTALASERTALRFMHDDEALYIAAVIADEKVSAIQRERDKGTWEDDCVEIFIDPQRERRDRFHLIVSARGDIFDAHLGDSKWNATPDVVRAVSVHEGKGWTVEMAIPFETLERKAPRRGEVWDLKLTREDYDRFGELTPRLSSWRYVGKSFSDAGAYGRLVFESTNCAINGDVSEGLQEGRWCNGFWRRSKQSHGGAVALEADRGHAAAPSGRAVIERYTQVQTCTPVTPLRNYRVSAWVNMDGVEDRVRLEMYQEKNTKVRASRKIEGWQKLETFVSMGDSKYLVMTFTIHGGKGVVLIDDLEVEEIDNVPRQEDAICYTGNAFASQARHNRQLKGRYTYCELGTTAAFFPQPEQRGKADVKLYTGWIDFAEGALTDGKPTYSLFHNWTMDPGKTLLIDLGEDCFVTDIELEPVKRSLRDVRIRFKPEGAARWTLVAKHRERGGTLQLTDLHAHTREIAIDYSGQAGMREVRIWGRDERAFAAPRSLAPPVVDDPAVAKGGAALADADFAIFPTPKQVTHGQGVMVLRDGLRIGVASDASDVVRGAAGRLAEAIAFQAGVKDIAVEASGAADIRLVLGEVEGGEEGYRLSITPTGATIEANTPRGLMHGGHTLVQCVSRVNGGVGLRAIEVADWPSYSLRAMQLWARQLTGVSLQRATESLARMKLNELVLMGGDSKVRSFCSRLALLGMNTCIRCADMPAGGWHRDVIEMNPGETIKDLPALSRVNPCPSNPKTYELIAKQIENAARYPGKYAYINCDEMYQEHKGARWNVCALCTARNMSGGDLFAELITHIHTELKKIGKTPVMLDTMFYVPWKMKGGFEKLPKDIPVGIWHPLAQKGLEANGFPVWEHLDGDTWTIDETRPNTVGAIVPGDGGLKLEKCAIWAEAMWSGRYPDVSDPAVLRRMTDQMARVHEATLGAPLPSRSASADAFTSIDVSAAGNVSLADEKANDGKGLFDLGPGMDLSFMQGRFVVGGVPFAIGEKLAAVENAGALDRRVGDRVAIDVNRQATSLVFLHTLTQGLTWTYAAQQSYAGSYLIEYEDGTRVDHAILYKRNILEFDALTASAHGYKSKLVTLPAGTPGYAGVLPSGGSILLMASEWVNPHPERTIRSITMQATSRRFRTRVALFAVTATGGDASTVPLAKVLPAATAAADMSGLKEIDFSGGVFESETRYVAPDGTVIASPSIYTLRGATLIHTMHVGYVTVDNNLGWQVSGGKPASIDVMFAEARKVAGVSVMGLPESPEYVFENRLSGFDYEVAVSVDGERWEQVAERLDYLPDREGAIGHVWPARALKGVRVTVKEGAKPACSVRGLARLKVYGVTE